MYSIHFMIVTNTLPFTLCLRLPLRFKSDFVTFHVMYNLLHLTKFIGSLLPALKKNFNHNPYKIVMAYNLLLCYAFIHVVCVTCITIT